MIQDSISPSEHVPYVHGMAKIDNKAIVFAKDYAMCVYCVLHSSISIQAS